MIDYRVLGPGDAESFEDIADGVLDGAPVESLVSEFLADDRHHIAVALEEGRIVGFASAVHYVHPDKPAEMWINEIGVAPRWRRRGVGRELLRHLFGLARRLGCAECWVLTERSNEAACALYRSVGGREGAPDAVCYSFRLEDLPA